MSAATVSIAPATRIELVNVAPDLARYWLSQNRSNRTIRRPVWKAYARDMEAGAWKVTAETIKLAPDGTLLDGHAAQLSMIYRAWNSRRGNKPMRIVRVNSPGSAGGLIPGSGAPMNHIGLLEFVYIVGAAWIVLAVAGTAGWSFMVSRLKARRVNRIPVYPPPIEATRPRDWWDDVAEVIDEDAAADREFWSLVRAWDERGAA